MVGDFTRALNRILLALGFSGVLFAPTRDGQVMPDRETAPAALSVARSRAGPPSAQLLVPDKPEFPELSGHLSRRYRIAPESTDEWVSAAHDTGFGLGLDPLLILAVIAIESSFNPIAESPAGAMGLMQVVPRYHQDTLAEHGGSGALLDPAVNIAVGARILKRYIHKAGSLEAGLQSYNGALPDASRKYAKKVLAERDRLRNVADRPERGSSPL